MPHSASGCCISLQAGGRPRPASAAAAVRCVAGAFGNDVFVGQDLPLACVRPPLKSGEIAQLPQDIAGDNGDGEQQNFAEGSVAGQGSSRITGNSRLASALAVGRKKPPVIPAVFYACGIQNLIRTVYFNSTLPSAGTGTCHCAKSAPTFSCLKVSAVIFQSPGNGSTTFTVTSSFLALLSSML